MPLLHRLVEDGHEVTVYFDIYRPELPLGGGVQENLVLIKGILKLSFIQLFRITPIMEQVLVFDHG